MRKYFLLLLAALMVPTYVPAAHKHKEKLQELAHKKRMKKAAKQAPGAKKLLHHK